jgi:hypothetical protein
MANFMPNHPNVENLKNKATEGLIAGWGCFYNKSISYLCPQFSTTDSKII